LRNAVVAGGRLKRRQDGGFPSQCGPLGERAYESAAGMKAGTGGNGFDQWTVIQKYWITVPGELDRAQLFEELE
jgi:hypothetical protein